MTEYKIATAADTDALENVVADLIDLGFRPVGGLAVIGDRLADRAWAQALVRETAPQAIAVGGSVPGLQLFDLEGD